MVVCWSVCVYVMVIATLVAVVLVGSSCLPLREAIDREKLRENWERAGAANLV